MKQYRSLILLAVVAVLLGGVYLIFIQPADPVQDGKLYALTADEGVKTISVSNSFGSFAFAREGGLWLLTQPGRYRANQQKTRVMEGYLVELPVNRALEGELAEYGFSQPFARISFTTTQGRSNSFLVGNQTPSKAQVYLKDLQSGKVFVADIGVVSQFDGSLAAYREKEVFSIDKANIASLTYFKNGVKQLAVEKRSSLEWQISYPFQAPARFVELTELVVTLRNWTSAGYVDEQNLDLAGLGLANPAEGLEVADSSGRIQRLDFGKVENGTVYVRAGSDQDILKLYAVDVDLSILNLESLLYITPLKTTIDQVAKIDLDYSGGKVHLNVNHAGDQASITTDKGPVPYEEFISFFVRYIGLSADGFEPAGKAGGAEMVFTTTFTNNSTTSLRLLKRDGASLYLEIDGKTDFYLSREKVDALILRLEAALAGSK